MKDTFLSPEEKAFDSESELEEPNFITDLMRWGSQREQPSRGKKNKWEVEPRL